MACQGTKVKRRLRTYRNELEECIEPQYGLLTKLVSLDVLCMREFEEINSKGSNSFKQSVELLNIMQHKTSNECEQFIDALNKKEQKHVVNFINEKARRFKSDHPEYFFWPLERIHRSRITRNLDQLVEMIECEHSGLLSTLYSRHCINRHQMSSITQVASTDIEKNTKLLTMLQRRSIRDYNVFVEFLKESDDMSYLADLFEHDVVVETVDCTIASPSVEHVREIEDKIVSEFRDCIRSVGQQRQERVRQWIRDVIHADCHPDIQLAAMKVGHSIRCFFVCKTPDALQSVYTLMRSGSLITTMQLIFQQLLGREESVSVVKITGRLNLDEQKKRLEEFHKDFGSDGAIELSKIRTAADVSGVKKPFWLPYEVQELILLRVAVILFKINRVCLLLPRPDVTTLAAIGSVCGDWFEIITGRRTVRRQLKFTFRRLTVLPIELMKAAVIQRHRLIDSPQRSRDADVSVLRAMTSVCRHWWRRFRESGDLQRRRVKRLCHYNPQLLVTLSQPPILSDGYTCKVRGVAILDSHLYVIYDEYSKVEVFDCEDRYKKVEDIEVREMENPWDMVGSSVTSQLFINEYISDAIWRVDLKTGSGDVFIRTDHSSYACLALLENRLLVRSRDSLAIYDIISCVRIRNIPLTEDMKGHVVRYASETDRDSLFLCHREMFKEKSTVSEIDSQGRVIRMFNNDEQLDCRYLALDWAGRLIVADPDNGSVVVLDKHLKYLRILFDKKRLDDAQPWRLHYDTNENRLLVGLNNGQVKIFERSVY